ncbi:MAG: S8 family serine peptidase [Bdellovibrionales bacterium]|nr:S8 family serine peptidase [Bdellovibrionales bacterium]
MIYRPLCISIFIFLTLPSLCQSVGPPSIKKSQRSVQPIIVAVIDTGMDLEHRDLKNWIFKNSKECGLNEKGEDLSQNGIDDDQNGYIDDCHGWNFADNNNDLQDVNGHGTHIAGIIIRQFLSIVSQKKNLGQRPIRLLPIRYFSGKEENTNVETTVLALKYAIQMGAEVINYSSGGYSQSARERSILQSAHSKGVWIVAAAGNHGMNIDLQGFYPAAYGYTNIISVGALDANHQLIPESNYGKHRVDVAAPGLEIVSTLPNDQYGTMSGTSQATAFVTGSIATHASRKSLSLPKPSLQSARQMLAILGQRNYQLFGKTAFSIEIKDNAARMTTSQDHYSIKENN